MLIPRLRTRVRWQILKRGSAGHVSKTGRYTTDSHSYVTLYYRMYNRPIDRPDSQN